MGSINSQNALGDGPFTRAEAIAAGISVRELASNSFVRVLRGIYVRADVELSPVTRAAAALHVAPRRAFASHSSAARLFRLPIPTDPNEHVTVHSPADLRRRSGVMYHLGVECDIVRRGGLRVSGPVRLFAELASTLALMDAVVLGDSIVQRDLVAFDALRQQAPRLLPRTFHRIESVLRLVREGAESPMETRARLLLHFAGLPEPKVNYEVGGPGGQARRRYDLSWLKARVIVEYDGRHHIEREPQWRADNQRREEAERLGWRVITLTAADIYQTPGQAIERVFNALRDRECPGLPARPTSTWQRYFPGR